LGTYAAFLAVVLITGGPGPVVLWKLLLAHLVLDVCTVASIFMLLLAISFWAGGSRRIDPLLYKIMPKGMVAVGVIVATILVTVGIALPPLGAILAAWFIVVFPAVCVVIILMRKRSRARLNQDM
jgi:hypothetical protein